MAGRDLVPTRGTLQAAPPPSVTESQRRLLADTFRLEGEAEVPWKPPVVKNPAAVKRVVEELARGLEPTRPIYLKWICDKLSALPTQTSNGLNAAIWADNVVDTCAHYPEDLLQAATLDVLRTKTFRPSPAELVALIEPRYGERQRMLERARSLFAPIAKAAEPYQREPLEVRLRTMRDGLRRHGFTDRAAKHEHELAKLEQRAPEEWATTLAVALVAEPAVAQPAPPPSRTADRVAELARARRSEPPPYDEIPE